MAIYHPRKPEASPLWKLLNNHYDSFEQCYERFEKKYGFLRHVIGDVVREYLTCGDLKNGFARVRCQDCGEEYLLAYSCKGRWFCPSCHAKKVIQFGESLRDNILYPVPHRQYVFSILSLAQYIIRNTFSVEKLTYIEETGTVVYHSKMTHDKDRKSTRLNSSHIPLSRMPSSA